MIPLRRFVQDFSLVVIRWDPVVQVWIGFSLIYGCTGRLHHETGYHCKCFNVRLDWEQILDGLAIGFSCSIRLVLTMQWLVCQGLVWEITGWVI